MYDVAAIAVEHPNPVPTRAFAYFLLVTFGISWVLIGVYVLAPEWASARFGEISGSHPVFFLATWAPAIAAFLVVFLFAGLTGVRAFLSRLLLWRCSPAWVAFILVLIPFVFVAGSLLKGGPVLTPLPPEGVSALVAVLFVMFVLGPIEEFGWRGVAQPFPQRHMAPI